MPKAILAIRSYPATLALALLLFLLTLIITTGSLGKVRSGGDGGDGGSGMGGTGKSGEFGGSGFGGTGGPSPFFTVTDPVVEEEQRPEHTLSAPATVVEQPSTLLAQDPVEPASPAEDTPLLEAIEHHPLVEETRQEIAQETPEAAEVLATQPEPVQMVEATPPLQRSEQSVVPANDVQPLVQEPTPAVQFASVPETPSDAVEQAAQQHNAVPQSEQAAEVQQLAETMTVKLDTAPEGVEPDRERPERVQRPDLPPFQRITPVERPTLFPPRVQPMRI